MFLLALITYLSSIDFGFRVNREKLSRLVHYIRENANFASEGRRDFYLGSNNAEYACLY